VIDCGHSFCENCLNSAKRPSLGPSFTIPCHVCRRPSSQLRKNFSLLAAAEIVRSSGQGGPSASRARVPLAGRCWHSAVGNSEICDSHCTGTQHAVSCSHCGQDWCLRCAAKVLASQAGYVEVAHDDVSRVIIFSKTDERQRIVRINVYYTTGTIGTCIAHPTKGKTQMFRRLCSYDEICSIFDHPRVHTGKGYYHKNQCAALHNSLIIDAGRNRCRAQHVPGTTLPSPHAPFLNTKYREGSLPAGHRGATETSPSVAKRARAKAR
jgi:hypothetical protein